MASKKTDRPRAGAHYDAGVERLLERVHLNSAGIDVGASQHWVAVPPDRAADPVQCFGAHTADLHRLADWLSACGIDTVAMENRILNPTPPSIRPARPGVNRPAAAPAPPPGVSPPASDRPRTLPSPSRRPPGPRQPS
jgi:hypothetical protein